MLKISYAGCLSQINSSNVHRNLKRKKIINALLIILGFKVVQGR